MIISCLLLIVCSNICIAEERGWWNYTNGQEITTICEQDECIWIGSHGGLVSVDRGNGNRTIYTRANSGLPSNIIHTVVCTDTGDLWVGTPDGLVKYDGQLWHVFTMSNSGLESDFITSLAYHDSTLLVGTGPYGYDTDGNLIGGGFSLYSGNGWITYTEQNSGLPSNYIKEIAVDMNDDTWLSTGAGLVKFSGSEWIADIACKDDGTVLVAWGDVLHGEGIARLEDGEWRIMNIENSHIATDRVRVIEIDESGNEWIGTVRGGLACYHMMWSAGTEEREASPVYPNPDRLTPDACYPNPFSRSITLRFRAPAGKNIAIDVLDPSGRTVRELDPGELAGGMHEVV